MYISVRGSTLENAPFETLNTCSSCVCVSSRACLNSSRGIALRASCTRFSTRARRTGSIFSRSSLKFRAMCLLLHGIDPLRTFAVDLVQVPLVNLVSLRNELVIPIRSPCLVSSDQENGSAPRIKSVKHPVRSALMLRSQLTHIVES